MTMIEAPLEELLAAIHPAELVREDVIVPSQLSGTGTSAYVLFLNHAGYKRTVTGRIEEAERSVDPQRQFPRPSLSRALSYALENAFERGHNDDPALALTVRYFIGEGGIVIQVKDSGQGFDYREVQRRYCAGFPRMQRAGEGFRSYNSTPDLTFSFEDGGSTINLVYRPSEEMVRAIKEAIPRN